MSDNKILIDQDILRMFTREGFIELFWETLQRRRINEPTISERAVFDDLNDRFCQVLGEFRYSSYDSFRQQKTRKKCPY